MPRIRPLHDLVLASRVSDAPLPSGLVLPEGVNKGDLWRLKAIEVGPGTTDAKGRFAATTIRPGDEFLAPPYADFVTKIDGQECWLVPERKALAVFRAEDEQAKAFECGACGSSNCAQPAKGE